MTKIDQSKKIIEDIIKPETDLERKILSDESFIEGAMWGSPREGHPEGRVIYHIGMVLENVNKYSDSNNRSKLRLISIIHDTFKNKVDKSLPKSGENHHAMIARRFAEKYISDTEILEILELHDEAYNAWCKGSRDNNWVAAERRSNALVKRIGDSLPLYMTFYRCDNENVGKENKNFLWFKDFLSRHYSVDL